MEEEYEAMLAQEMEMEFDEMINIQNEMENAKPKESSNTNEDNYLQETHVATKRAKMFQPILEVPKLDIGYSIKLNQSFHENKKHKNVVDHANYIQYRKMGNFKIPFTLENGDQVYLGRKVENGLKIKEKHQVELKLPISELEARIEKRQINATMQNEEIVEDATTHNCELWASKYRPARFIELLSDEKTNRQVLSWIKSWEKYIFNVKVKGEMQSENDDTRPHEKILLLAGVPGSGKTTLASVVARHAGYNPVEINASDDRTVSMLKNKIANAMEMNTLISQKPNCIILDEIDGAMNGSDGMNCIALLSNMAKASIKKNTTGKKSTVIPIQCPIICICNELYAPVLRPLHNISRVLTMREPDSRRIVQRLKFIAEEEHIKVDSARVLSLICMHGESDIRYCMNTLQLAAMKHSRITVKSLSSILGSKDKGTKIYDIWDELFQSSSAKRAKPGENNKAQTELSTFHDLYETLMTAGNHDVIANGAFEYTPHRMLHDSSMKYTSELMDCFGLVDTFQTRINAYQDYHFMVYLPISAMTVKRVVRATSAGATQTKLSFPKLVSTVKTKKIQQFQILKMVLESSRLQSNTIRVGPMGLVMDVLPLLIHILNPPLQNPTLHNAADMQTFQRVTGLLSKLGFTYREQYDSALESKVYRLDPYVDFIYTVCNTCRPIQDIVMPILDALVEIVKFTRLPQTLCARVARQLKLETIRREEASKRISSKPQIPKVHSVAPEVQVDAASKRRNPFAYAHKAAKKIKDKIRRSDSSHRAEPKFRYKFHQGYTCGIKRKPLMSELIFPK